MEVRASTSTTSGGSIANDDGGLWQWNDLDVKASRSRALLGGVVMTLISC